MDNLFLQVVKSRLLNPDYDSDDSLPQDVMNKKNLLIQKFSPSINPKVLIWKVTRLSISLTQPVQQIRLINGMLIQRQILFFNNWWFEINDWWFQYEGKEYHKCKKGTTAKKTLMLLILVLFMGRSLTTMQTSKLIMRNMSMID